MSENIGDRPGFDGAGAYIECPLPSCPTVIRLAPPEEVGTQLDFGIEIQPGETFLDAITRATRTRLEEHYAANEALIEYHLRSEHTVVEFAIAYGTARNALMEIHAIINGPDYAEAQLAQIDAITHRGLGE